MRSLFIPLATLGILAAAPVMAQNAAPSAEQPTAQEMAQPAADQAWLPSLMTETPQAGFDLAFTMARKAVTTTQTDKQVLHALRPNYSTDPQSLIDVSGVAAHWFATVAAANDYWRDQGEGQ